MPIPTDLRDRSALGWQRGADHTDAFRQAQRRRPHGDAGDELRAAVAHPEAAHGSADRRQQRTNAATTLAWNACLNSDPGTETLRRRDRVTSRPAIGSLSTTGGTM